MITIPKENKDAIIDTISFSQESFKNDLEFSYFMVKRELIVKDGARNAKNMIKILTLASKVAQLAQCDD